jgi:hypothetical protein
MTDDRPEVLLAGLDDATALRVVTLLEPLGVRFQRAPWWAAVAGVATGNRFEMVVVELPEDVPRLGSMIHEVRRSTSRSHQAALIVVCDRVHEETARDLVGRGANRVLTRDRLEQELVDAATLQLDMAPRFRIDIAARVASAEADGLAATLDCVLRNISRTGMLLEGDLEPSVGSTVEFELDLPAEEGGLRGSGRVVWTAPTDTGRRIGVRFEPLSEAERRRLDLLLSGLTN